MRSKITNKSIKEQVLPKYREIIQETVKVYQGRMWDISKVAMWIAIPFSVFVIGAYFFRFLNGGSGDLKGDLLGSFLLFFLIFGFFYIGFTYFIRKFFFIEKLIWLDSYFDEIYLSREASKTIAKKIFWPYYLYNIIIFFHYYFIGFVVYLFCLGATAVFMFKADIFFLLFVFLFFLLSGPFFLWIYFYYLDFKLKFFWFIFLDRFGTKDFSYLKIRKEMLLLNDVSKTAMFKKVLKANFGISVTKVFFNLGNDFLVFNFLKQYSRETRNVVSKLENLFVEELSNQMAEVTKNTTKYLLYQYARHELYGTKQVVNKKIYTLINEK